MSGADVFRNTIVELYYNTITVVEVYFDPLLLYCLSRTVVNPSTEQFNTCININSFIVLKTVLSLRDYNLELQCCTRYYDIML